MFDWKVKVESVSLLHQTLFGEFLTCQVPRPTKGMECPLRSLTPAVDAIPAAALPSS